MQAQKLEHLGIELEAVHPECLAPLLRRELSWEHSRANYREFRILGRVARLSDSSNAIRCRIS